MLSGNQLGNAQQFTTAFFYGLVIHFQMTECCGVVGTMTIRRPFQLFFLPNIYSITYSCFVQCYIS